MVVSKKCKYNSLTNATLCFDVTDGTANYRCILVHDLLYIMGLQLDKFAPKELAVRMICANFEHQITPQSFL